MLTLDWLRLANCRAISSNRRKSIKSFLTSVTTAGTTRQAKRLELALPEFAQLGARSKMLNGDSVGPKPELLLLTREEKTRNPEPAWAKSDLRWNLIHEPKRRYNNRSEVPV